jgi:sugar lactone lactonase YvrE
VLTCAARPVVRPVWPPPPDRARIEYVEAWTGPRDFAPDFWKRLSNFAGGQGAKEAIVKPTGIAVSPDGQRVYVADAVRHAVYTFDRGARRVKIRSLDDVARGPTTPFGLALDGEENVYVTDQAGRVVVVMSRDGRFLRAIGRDTLARPVGCAVDPQRGLLYVADAPQGSGAPHRIAAFALDGRFVRWIGARGLEPGRFNYPTYLTVSPAGELLVVDTLNWRVQVFGGDGGFVRAFGRHSDARGDFDRPKGIALDRFGNVYVADGSWDRVLIFSRHGRPLLDFGGRGTWPGGLQEPTAVAIGGDDRIYVADTNGHRVNVYRLINTTAADSVASGGGDH